MPERAGARPSGRALGGWRPRQAVATGHRARRVRSVTPVACGFLHGPRGPSPRPGRRSCHAVTPGCQSGDRPRLASPAMRRDRLHQEHALPARKAARFAGGWETHAPATRAGGSGQSGRQVDDPPRRVDSRTRLRGEVQAMSRHAIRVDHHQQRSFRDAEAPPRRGLRGGAPSSVAWGGRRSGLCGPAAQPPLQFPYPLQAVPGGLPRGLHPVQQFAVPVLPGIGEQARHTEGSGDHT
jgi:hypothetical protein